jgi:EAL domain-containing protein (putative c-di-GMP-specific phosphodiesterase class I)
MANMPEFSFAFQPIVNVAIGEIISYEALVRGVGDTPASEIFKQIDSADKYSFDEMLRIKAIDLAAAVGLTCNLNLNFLPQSLDISNDTILKTINAAERNGIHPSRLVIEVTETEIIRDTVLFAQKMSLYRNIGVTISIDDFGAGYSGLNLLAEFLPDQIKIDMSLIRQIHLNGPRQAIVRGVIRTCLDLGIDILAEGVETEDEFHWCYNEGIEIFQGYLFGKPLFEKLGQVEIANLN